MTMTCGEALIRLLERYGVDTIFGIPGVHNLEMYRGLSNSSIEHVQARNEQGAGFMADGYARASGRPGVALVISGPGVTNVTTALGQAFADSIPMLLISAVTSSHSLGRGWGALHEITDQEAVTRPLTALSATAMSADDVPELVGQAFTIFGSQRPRPVHISIPLDVAEMPTDGDWSVALVPSRPQPNADEVAAAAALLLAAERPCIYMGGGAIGADRHIVAIAERLNAAVFSSNAGKGIIPESHPLSVGSSVSTLPTQKHLAIADVLLAIGTEIAETDHFAGDKLPLHAQIIRIDIDPAKIDDLYTARVGIVADATDATADLLAELGSGTPKNTDATEQVADTRNAVMESLTPSERQRALVLSTIRRALPDDTIIMTDMTQLVYTGSSIFTVESSRKWLYPAGFCVLGCGVPGAIGAKLAMPNHPVAAIVGDGGFMFTPQELIVAVQLQLSIPVILWNNNGLNQITDNMNARGITPLGTDGINPDFLMLAESMGARGVRPDSMASLESGITDALKVAGPTVIEIVADADWIEAN